MNVGQLFTIYATIILEFLLELYILYFLVTKKLKHQEHFKTRLLISTVCLLVISFIISIFYYYFGNTVIGRILVYTSLFILSIVHLKVLFDEDLKKMTQGSNALNDFKEILSKSKFLHYFPPLDYEVDKDLRKSYKGGFTYLNPIYKEKDVGKRNTFYNP